MTYGLTQGQIMALTIPDDIDLQTPAVRIDRRKKGKGAAGGWRPLPTDAKEALEQFIAANAGGKFSSTALRNSWHRACRRFGVPKIRPYDLRHSFAVAVLDQTQDMKATQRLLGHASDKTTARYATRAMPTWLLGAVAKVRTLRHDTVPDAKK
jgi:integrase